MTIMLINNKT